MNKNRFDNLLNSILGSVSNFGSMYDFLDKDATTSVTMRYMFARTQSMFEYEGLPDTIPARMLEIYLQINGSCCITSINGELYALVGGFGGEPDPYYMPTIYTVANPSLNISKNLVIDSDCVIIPNDSMYIGLRPLFNKYASLLTENEISLQLASINTRMISLLSAADDMTKESAKQYIKDIVDGKLGVIGESKFFDGIKSQPNAQNSNNIITNLIELHQYIKASLYNEIGLNANYNMKRESINSDEASLNDDALKPFIDDMLEQRQQALEKVNNMFGTSITVRKSSIWAEKEQEQEEEQEQEDNTDDAENTPQ